MSTDQISLEALSTIAGDIRSLLGEGQMKELAGVLEASGFTVPSLRDLDGLTLSPSLKNNIRRSLGSAEGTGGVMAISLLLLQPAPSEPSSSLELCWTGPKMDSTLRMTWPALSDIILAAKETIVVVGYVVTPNMRAVMDYLERKSREGIKLIFIVDRMEEKEDFLEWVRNLPRPPELYSRPEDPDYPMSALHVKCIIVDERVAMFGSANLTYHGMKRNIELGLLLKHAGTVRRIVRLIERLKPELVRIEP